MTRKRPRRVHPVPFSGSTTLWCQVCTTYNKRLREVELVGFDENGLLILESILSTDTWKRVIPKFHTDYTRTEFPFSSKRSIKVIVQLLPRVVEFEPVWKVHHLVQCTFSALGLHWAGLLDIDIERFERTMQG